MLLKPEGSSYQYAPSTRLSKSKFLSGLQCSKRLFLEVHSPHLATQPDEQTQAVLDMGTSVGELARQRFQGGVLVDATYRQTQLALTQTQEFIQQANVPALFEGAFFFNNVLVRVDVLERGLTKESKEQSWKLIEVKASTRVKDTHVDDLAIQMYVLEGMGLNISSACLMYVNNQYIYEGSEIDIQRLFSIADVTIEVKSRLEHVAPRLIELQDVLQQAFPPAIRPDGHCHSPYRCHFWEHCTQHKSSRWVYYLPGKGKSLNKLLNQGIETIDEIPENFRLTQVQRRMKESREWVGPQLQSLLNSVTYPVHHLDFETFMPALPRFPNTRPYQSIPTQWSNHIQRIKGVLSHEEYLCMEAKDPREEFAQTLVESLGSEGSICVYSNYERAILEGLCEAVPSLKKELQGIIRRLWDLFPIIRDHYYHPDFQGSFSIKSVLPALVPELDYRDLRIQDGGTAAQQYEKMIFHEMDWVERATIREALLSYCKRDTLAMVEIRKVLYEKCKRRD